MLAFLDTGAECTLIYGNLERFRGPLTAIDGYGGQSIWVQAVTLTLGVGHLPPCLYKIHVSPSPDYILGIDILASLLLQTTIGDFWL